MTRTKRGEIEFTEDVPDEFLDLFIQTVEQSEFIETEWVPGDPMSGHDKLAVYEVVDDSENRSTASRPLDERDDEVDQ